MNNSSLDERIQNCEMLINSLQEKNPTIYSIAAEQVHTAINSKKMSGKTGRDLLLAFSKLVENYAGSPQTAAQALIACKQAYKQLQNGFDSTIYNKLLFWQGTVQIWLARDSLL